MKNQQLNIESNTNIKTSWNLLAKLTLSRIILFNKRRSGESAKITIENYNSRSAWGDENTEELKNSLSDVERKLAACLTLIEIRGKGGRKVPVLLSSVMKDAIDILIKSRNEAGIISENRYIFARSSNSLNQLRGHDCLNQVMDNVILARPELITGTKLRKYVATVAQIFNLSKNEYDWLARHLGHDIRVHREFYRPHESAVELTKVSRILIAVDAGKVAEFAGKELQDINIEDVPHVEEELQTENLDDEEKSDNEMEVCEPRETENTIGKTSAPIAVPVTKKQKGTKVSWTIEEKEGVLNFFKVHIKKGSVEKKHECEECMEKYPVLKKRKWSDLKFCVKNQISKVNKKIK
ncbi:hypothetical protein FQR65_LT17931 [Abscondita terminalis]|nr:hypothetical protein FQR65_LT17931 [Abscondita terminalis]